MKLLKSEKYSRHSFPPQKSTSSWSPTHLFFSEHWRVLALTPRPHEAVQSPHEVHDDQYGHRFSLHGWIFSNCPTQSIPATPPRHSRCCAIMPPPHVLVHKLNWPQLAQVAHAFLLHAWVIVDWPKHPLCPEINVLINCY